MIKGVTDQMIREAAYFLWEKAGCPNGSGESFWIMACEQFYGKRKGKNKRGIQPKKKK